MDKRQDQCNYIKPHSFFLVILQSINSQLIISFSVLSGNGMKLPVLWAKGGTAQLYAGESEVSENHNDYGAGFFVLSSQISFISISFIIILYE
jgi:hypothetical protein